jgi:hypothetical protein
MEVMTMTNQELKSKVVSLANRLTSKMGGDKSAAFIQAWAIVKAGGLTLQVRGVTFGNRQEALRRLAAYAPDRVRAFIVPEPENPVDPAALAVMVGVQGGKGLVPAGLRAPRPGLRGGGPGRQDGGGAGGFRGMGPGA